jgi:hypothetical protein
MVTSKIDSAGGGPANRITANPHRMARWRSKTSTKAMAFSRREICGGLVE